MGKEVLFFDAEIGTKDHKIQDIGTVRGNATFHSANVNDLVKFSNGVDYICGHNVILHDIKYLREVNRNIVKYPIIDTLYLSPLLFPGHPYHKLLKDDKLQVDQINNPVNDAEKAKELFLDEVKAFNALPNKVKQIYTCLLYSFLEFKAFFDYVSFIPYKIDLESTIRTEFENQICESADIKALIQNYPIELAYSLALISTKDSNSITPFWLKKNYPKIDSVMKYLCFTPCETGCRYCKDRLDIHKNLKSFFGFDEFRTYDGEPLQEKAVQAAVKGKSLVAVFPTGGGKSITFQLPALMAGECAHGLTVVISPLLSLMKDQVDNLNEKGLIGAVSVNGLLSPIERKEALERVESGKASMLYIAPEQLRSKTIERLLLSRNVVRFVIDEAHCFSAWGHDFRVDYLFIGDFIKKYQEQKQAKNPIPVSCFTATAKQKVITDICDYFKKKLGVDLELYTSQAERENLHYTVLFKETDEEKYNTLRSLISTKKCPTIVYVSRTKQTELLATKLTSDGFKAVAFNGKMESNQKVINQDAFLKDEVRIIVATSAFGMGVDKKDVKLVVHYDISDSLENYLQEAGRAGRDQSLQADCYVLYNNNDLDKHFLLLNQTKLSISEIQQVWKAVKDFTKERKFICCSPLELARQAGWDETREEIETRVKTAIAALENAGYIRRGRNVPHVFATGILAKDMAEASARIESSNLYNEKEKQQAKRVIKSLISSRSIATANNADAESRVDYLADMLGIPKEDIINVVNLMKQDNLLEDTNDMSAYLYQNDTLNKSALALNRFSKLELFLLTQINSMTRSLPLKEINEKALNDGINFSNVKMIRTLLYFLTIKGYISKSDRNSEEKSDSNSHVYISLAMPYEQLLQKYYKRMDICNFILEELFQKSYQKKQKEEEILVEFSLVGLWKKYCDRPNMMYKKDDISLRDVEDALLYLSKIGSMKLEGGFLVLYNGMEIEKLVSDNKTRYKVDDYKTLSEYYQMKIQQIHIVGEYANLMVKDYNKALQFVRDYFYMDYKKFIQMYFKGERAIEIENNITPAKYKQLFGNLSETQRKIITDSESKYIVVAAGPGSGKTRVLVHKLASLLLLEDVKHEQLLMLTFSRAAATEFKKRLIELIGSAASYVEIKTFHSYCFDLLGKNGTLENSENVVREAAEKIACGEVEIEKITKNVLVIDEAQDMDENEFALVKALMKENEDMRVIAVGDDDQNIFEFRGSSSQGMKSLIEDYQAKKYEMVENYRSKGAIVELANCFALSMKDRMKTTLIKPVQKDRGYCEFTEYGSKNIEVPLVEELVKQYKGETTCVLTPTNEEALKVLDLLLKQGVNAKLIQAMDGLKLYNLAEVRYFLKLIDEKIGDSPTIGSETWEYAKQQVCKKYYDSICLENFKNMVVDFEATHIKLKFRTDLDSFIYESEYEDFYSKDTKTVFVSTIHKAKGREFDSVYLILSESLKNNEETKRRVYVALTRAKSNLYIHSNTFAFGTYFGKIVKKKEDNRYFEEPEDITLQLSYRDVFLSFFTGRESITDKLHAGTVLSFSDGKLYANVNGSMKWVAKTSKACNGVIEELSKKGYQPVNAEVRYQVLWKNEEDQKETIVLLPNIHFKKNK